MNFDNKEQIIDRYLSTMRFRLSHLGEEDLSQLRDIAESRYIDKKILINNSYLCEDRVMTSSEFLSDVLSNDIIINENGCLFKNPTSREEIPPPVECEIYLSIDRNKKKALMKYYMDERKGNDPLKSEYNNKAQNNCKEAMNIYYGALQVGSGPFFNIDLAETITCRGRSMVAVSALTVEGIFDGYVPNSLDGILYYIDVHSRYPNIAHKIYSNPNNKNYSKQDILERLSLKVPMEYLKYVDDVLETKTQEQLNAIYIKNNFVAWCELEEVDSALRKFYKHLQETGTAFLNPYTYDPTMLDLIKNIQQYVHLLHGFVWYQETVSRYNEILNNPQDTIRDMDRYYVALIDTDSNMIAMLLRYMHNEYFDHLTKEELDFTYTNTLAIIADKAVVISMANYTEKLNVPEEYRSRVAMKNEYYYSDFALTRRKKNYAGLMCLKEGVPFSKPKLDVKGLMFIKSVVNENTAMKIEDIVDNDILRSDSIDCSKILYKLNKASEELEAVLRTEEGSSYYVPEKINAALLKILPAQARTKSVELYNILGIGNKIVAPSKFYTIKIDISQSNDSLLISRFMIYKKIYEIHMNIRKYTDFDIPKFVKSSKGKLIIGHNSETVAAETMDNLLLLLEELISDRIDLDIFVSSYINSNRKSSTPMSRDEIFYYIIDKFNNDTDTINEYLDGIIDYIKVKFNEHNSRYTIPYKTKKKYFVYKAMDDSDFTRLSIPDEMISNLPQFILDTINTVNEVTNIDNLAAPILTNIRVAIMKNEAGKNLVSNVLEIF